MSEKLMLGLPKGSLETATAEMFKKAGWKVEISSRSYYPRIDDEDIDDEDIDDEDIDDEDIDDEDMDVGEEALMDAPKLN